MQEFLRKRWFLIALVGVIALGHGLGAAALPALAPVLTLLADASVKAGLIAGVLFLMSVTLDSRRLGGALLSPGPVLWALIVNALLMPLTAPLLMPLQLSPDFAVGLLIAASVPCTLAAASVWTRRAGGNDAISLVVTLVTNSACFLYTPFWLRLFGDGAVVLDPRAMIWRLFLTALVPTLLGQTCRLLRTGAVIADRYKTPLGVVAQVGILVTVFVAACEAGERLTAPGPEASLRDQTAPTAFAVIVVAGCCLGLHLAAVLVAWSGARLARFPRADAIAVAFAGSQKTLPIGILIATDPQTYGAAFPWAMYPMLLFHVLQLFADTTIADRIRAGGETEKLRSENRSSETGEGSSRPISGTPDSPISRPNTSDLSGS